MNMDECAAIMADSYKNVAVLKREEGIDHPQDPIVRSPKLRGYDYHLKDCMVEQKCKYNISGRTQHNP